MPRPVASPEKRFHPSHRWQQQALAQGQVSQLLRQGKGHEHIPDIDDKYRDADLWQGGTDGQQIGPRHLSGGGEIGQGNQQGGGPGSPDATAVTANAKETGAYPNMMGRPQRKPFAKLSRRFPVFSDSSNPYAPR